MDYRTAYEKMEGVSEWDKDGIANWVLIYNPITELYLEADVDDWGNVKYRWEQKGTSLYMHDFAVANVIADPAVKIILDGIDINQLQVVPCKIFNKLGSVYNKAYDIDAPCQFTYLEPNFLMADAISPYLISNEEMEKLAKLYENRLEAMYTKREYNE